MKMLRAPALLLVVFLAFLAGSPAAAGSSAALAAEDIQHFLDSMPDFERLGEKYADREKNERKAREEMAAERQRYASMAPGQALAGPTPEQIERMKAPFSASLGEMRKSEGYDELVATVKRHGFDSVEQWAAVGDRSMRAYLAAKMETEMPKMDAQMEKLRGQLAQSGMSMDQQKAMMKMMDASSQTLSAFQDVPEADKSAIAPFVEQFDALSHDEKGNRRRDERREMPY